MRTQTLLQVNQSPSLPERAYSDIKDGAFAALLILAVSALWFSHVWGKDVKQAIADFTQTMRSIAKQVEANTVAVEELADHVHKVDDRLESLEGHVTKVEQVAQTNKATLTSLGHSKPQ